MPDQKQPSMQGSYQGDRPSYLPIRAYAAIGDCHGAALVAEDGGIDWCCLKRFDDDPVFFRLLDASRGGFLSVRPSETFQARRHYLEGTNILRTEFETASGKVALTDFMPVGRRPGAAADDYVTLNAPHALVRVVEGLEGAVRLEVGYRPSVEFARRAAPLSALPGRIEAEGGPTLYSDLPLGLDGDVARAGIELRAGERRRLLLTPAPLQQANPLDSIPALWRITQAFWEEWIGYCRYHGPYVGAVHRSALTLKLLTYAPSGALVAAPTTSLPERIGGGRNWDYRYCWLRDASFTLYALAALGYSGEARQFCEFLCLCCLQTLPRVQILYGVGGETELSERALDHLEGYEGSRPVRVGNAAYQQRQIDVYGEIFDWASLYQTLGGRIDQRTRQFLTGVEAFVSTHWREPDEGLWEMRGPLRHHVHGKVMAWVALDRAASLFGQGERWIELREDIRRDVLANGLHPERRHFVQAYGERKLDAALLLLPMLDFPVDRALIERTVDAVQRELRHGDFVKRYEGEDGLEGDEGAFLICSFWLVDALLWLGREKEARALYERLLACANDVGLYSEEIDPDTGAFLGNFPQAFTHLALVGSAIHFQIFERGGHEALRGSYAHRARYSVQGREPCRREGQTDGLHSSQQSVLPTELLR